MGCGYFKLWKHGKLSGLKLPEFSGDEGRDAVKAAEGSYEVLQGKHYEAHVVINLVGGKTLEPKHHNQRFVVDGVTPSSHQMLRGDCYVFAGSGILEDSYRRYGVERRVV